MSDPELADRPMTPCEQCGRLCPAHLSRCSWECRVEQARKAGGHEHTPNGLPVRCIRADGTMLEHEHGDHPRYRFPVDAEFIGPVTDQLRDDYLALTGNRPPSDDEVRRMNSETHALIHSDEDVAMTLYECSYFLWVLHDGHLASSPDWGHSSRRHWRLSDESLKKVRGE